MKAVFSKVLPFFFLGIFLVLMVVGFVILSYLLIAGAIVGFILFIIAWIRDLFFKKNKSITKKSGHIIDHDDLK